MRAKISPFTVMVTIGTNSDSFEKPLSINRYRQHTMKLIFNRRLFHVLQTEARLSLTGRSDCEVLCSFTRSSFFSSISASATKHVLIQLKHLLDQWRNPLGREKEKDAERTLAAWWRTKIRKRGDGLRTCQQKPSWSEQKTKHRPTASTAKWMENVWMELERLSVNQDTCRWWADILKGREREKEAIYRYICIVDGWHRGKETSEEGMRLTSYTDYVWTNKRTA